jgi:hypothetical protein
MWKKKLHGWMGVRVLPISALRNKKIDTIGNRAYWLGSALLQTVCWLSVWDCFSSFASSTSTRVFEHALS